MHRAAGSSCVECDGTAKVVEDGGATGAPARPGAGERVERVLVMVVPCEVRRVAVDARYGPGEDLQLFQAVVANDADLLTDAATRRVELDLDVRRLPQRAGVEAEEGEVVHRVHVGDVHGDLLHRGAAHEGGRRVLRAAGADVPVREEEPALRVDDEAGAPVRPGVVVLEAPHGRDLERHDGRHRRVEDRLPAALRCRRLGVAAATPSGHRQLTGRASPTSNARLA
mmetsp:Transcript_22997/g.64189  ORF Transcript_22997/g.64189 Transcript_22997/m.64189 type:complete len:226 (-) Transcript_22997:30-707(-)